MKKQSLLRRHSGSSVLSVGLHLALIGAFTVGVRFSADPLYPIATGEVAIQATVVDEALIEREIARLEEQEQAEILQRQEEEREAREQAQAAQRELEEQQRQLDLARQEQEQREQEAVVEQQRLTELQRDRAAEEQRQAEAERLRIEEEQRQAEAEQLRIEEEQRQAEAEQLRIEEEQRQAEAEMHRVMAAEEERQAAEKAGLLDQYRLIIQDRIERSWIPPASAVQGLRCEVTVTQIPSGDVVGVRVGTCNGDDAVVRSIEAAVQRASPLPRPSIPALFDRILIVTFAPDG